ncbi:hypothetical protein QL285_097478 [Trifolium repens]|nr:hypothetical protein QL285_097478 [Trifolium repens]
MGGIHLNLIQLYLASGLGVVKQGLSRSTDLVKKSSHLSQKALNAALKVDGDFPTARSRIYPCSAGHSLRAEIMDCFRDYVVSERFEINQRCAFWNWDLHEEPRGYEPLPTPPLGRRGLAAAVAYVGEQHRYQIVLYKGNWLEEKERKENGVLALVVGRKVLSSLELINYSTQLSKQNTKKSIKQTL